MKREYYVSRERIAKRNACDTGLKEVERLQRELNVGESAKIPFTKRNLRAVLRAYAYVNLTWFINKIADAPIELFVQTTESEDSDLHRLQAAAEVVVHDPDALWDALDKLITYREELERKYRIDWVTGERF